jgi:hypothetical protein
MVFVTVAEIIGMAMFALLVTQVTAAATPVRPQLRRAAAWRAD